MRNTRSLLGLSEQDITVYRFLLSHSVATIPVVSAATGITAEHARVSLGQLVTRGLVSVGQDGLARVVPAAAEDIAQRLVAEADAQHAQRIGQISALRSELFRLATEQISTDTDVERIEVVRNAVTTQLRTTELLNSAQRQILIMQGTLRGIAWRRLWIDVGTALGRNVEVRAICAPSPWTDPDGGAGAEVMRAEENGAFIRIAPDMPATLVVIDKAIAVVRDLASGIPGIAIVRGTGVLTTLHTLFTAIWRASESRRSPGSTASEDRPVDEREFQILRLLSLGMKDEAIANHAGLSVRTVRRIISTIMARVGVTSRFEMGALCVRKGWL